LRKLLGVTIVEVRRAQIDPRAASAIASLASTFLKAAELGDLENRVRALEQRRTNERQKT
jgi:hypothetical protein